MRSKGVWILLLVGLAVAAALLVWRPWRHTGPTEAQRPAAPAGKAQAPRSRYEPQRAQAEISARQGLDAEAVAVLADTDVALQRIGANDKPGALAALERAAGKANILVGQNPAAALIPAATEVQIIDVAPSDIDQVRKLRRSLELAVLTDDFAQARVILDVLRSEIRVRTLYVPLATYPAALAQAAGLVERGNMAAAAEALDRARNTLAMTDVVTPLPLLVAQAAIDAAKADADNQKKLQHLAAARSALELTEVLGYADRGARKALLADILKIESEAKGGSDIQAALTRFQTQLSEVIGKLKGERKGAQP